MIELSTIRDLVAIFGVIAGFSYYVLTVRMNQRAVRINLTNTWIQRMSTDDWGRKFTELMYMEWEDYDDFERKYGSDVNNDNFIMRTSVWVVCDNLGNLLKIGMADKDVLYNSLAAYNAASVWHKFVDVLNMNRKLYSGSAAWSGFEYLANEVDKIRKQRNPEFDSENYSFKYTDLKKQKAKQ
jgi:hypothetical protein